MSRVALLLCVTLSLWAGGAHGQNFFLERFLGSITSSRIQTAVQNSPIGLRSIYASNFRLQSIFYDRTGRYIPWRFEFRAPTFNQFRLTLSNGRIPLKGTYRQSNGRTGTFRASAVIDADIYYSYDYNAVTRVVDRWFLQSLSKCDSIVLSSISLSSGHSFSSGDRVNIQNSLQDSARQWLNRHVAAEFFKSILMGKRS